ncbi:Hypothetical predicted protein [Mytilus galloprovincialis]|uniref:Reverse transcriptase domain-containing protein n=1 Tax=Mytilus galloprovincialis TaxID=29158 RepID=A0A8B6H7K1_MYTGA|nr:Hypothetical predicted protein [Mytilus galloprovincialis]
MTDHRSEDEDELLLHESSTPSVLNREAARSSLPVPVPSTATQRRAPQPHISDGTFQLLTSYFDSKISALKNELVSGNDSLATKLKKEASVKLKSEERLRQAEKQSTQTIKEKKGRTNYTKPSATVPDLLLILQICLINSTTSPFGGTVAVRRLPMTCAMNATSSVTGEQTVPIEATSNLQQETTQPHKIKDKYLNLVDEYLLHGHMNILLEHVKYFDKVDFSKLAKGVKSSLSKNVAFWEHIGASKFIIDTIKSGYMIPFVIDNTDFVNEAVLELSKNGCVHEVPFQPFVVNPLSVAIQKSGKKRLILDLSELNVYVLKNKIKFEDWKVAQQFFKKDIYLIIFDLRSGYFHLDICKEQHTYLGFSWNGKFYCFSVLAFGLSSAPYIFTKCLRPMVKYRRENGVDIVLYLDDGLDIAYTECVLAELRFWSDSLTNLDQKKFVNDTLPNIVVYSDASNVAAGAFTVEVNEKVFHSTWSEYEKNMSSTWRELRAIQLALYSFKSVLKNSTVKWHTDNQNCVKIIDRGSTKMHLQCFAYDIFKFCSKERVIVQPIWVPRSENCRADFLSKMIDIDDWQTSPEFFEFMDNLCGPYTVDRFANFAKKSDLFKFWNRE